MNIFEKFSLKNQVAVITGGAGLLGAKHAEAIAEAGGIPVIWDINVKGAMGIAKKIYSSFGVAAKGMKVDVTDIVSIKSRFDDVLSSFKRVDILINNAANDPKVKKNGGSAWGHFRDYPLEAWNQDIAVGLTSTFLCSQIIGTYMANHRRGVILNIASDLSVISPDQRIYRKKWLSEDKQPIKPVSYSVLKHGLIGLTKYLATYWADKNVRVNALSPGGVYDNHPADFVKKLVKLIPMGRMANPDEYKAAVLFLVSNASSYMTGANLIIDGGKTCW